MLRGIVNTGMKFHILIIAIAAVFLIVGVTQFNQMAVDVLPEFEPPYVEIQTEALGLSAEEVEQLITVPMEQDLLNGVAWLDTIRSESVPGLSSVLLFFEPGTDLYKARQMVAERLTQAAVGLPHVSKPPVMIQPLSSTSRFMIVGLSSQELSLIEMSVLARWTIAPRLMGVPGVANVAIWGQRERQLQVQVDPERLRANGITLQQILETTGNALWVSSLSFLEASTPGTGGFIDTPNQRLGIWHVLPITSPDELAQVPIEGSGVHLGSVTNVVEDHQPLIGDAIVNNNPNLMLVVEKFPGTNMLDVTTGVEAALEALAPGLAGIQMDTTLFRPASFIESAVSNLSRSVLIAAFLILIVLILLLNNWKAALISFITIPLAIITALMVFYARGMSINSMVLTGLAVAIGVLIDDAVVDINHVMQRFKDARENGKNESAFEIIFNASSEARSTLLYATIIIALTMLPMFFMEGVSGAFFQPFAVTFLLAILASMLVALTVTPALTVLFFANNPTGNRDYTLLNSLKASYERVLNKVLHNPRPAFIAASLLMVIAIAVVPFMRNEQLLPAFQEPYFMVQWEGPPGTSRNEMNRIVARATNELESIEGVRRVGAHVGRAIFGDKVVGINSANLWLSIDPNANYDSTIAAIRETVNGYPGLVKEVNSYLQETIRQSLSRSSQESVVRIFGEDQVVLQEKAEEVRQAISNVPGVIDLQVHSPVMEPTLKIVVNLGNAQRYGIKPGDVRRSVATLVNGLQVGSLFENQKVFDVVVWSEPSIRANLQDIKSLLIDRPDGGHVRLEDVASVSITPVPSVIRREGVSPYMDVGFNMADRDLSQISSDVQTALLGIQFPLEYHAEILGEFAERQNTQRRITIAAFLSLLGMLLVLQAAFSNWKLAVITMLTFPVALSGSVLAGYLENGGSLSLGSLIGALTVFGIFIRTTILQVAYFHRLEEENYQEISSKLILEGGTARFLPIVTTNLTLAATLLPFVIFGNVPGMEIIRPMAIVIIGGLVTMVFYCLYIVPAFYLRFGLSRETELQLFTPQALGEVHAGD